LTRDGHISVLMINSVMNTNQHIQESGFEVGDLHLVLVPKLHIDEFCSKIGNDSDIVVISFLVNDKTAAQDLVNFFETGYDWILDSDISASEIKPGSFLVFVEILRRTRLIDQIFKMIGDLSAASGLKKNDWKFRYVTSDKYWPLRKETIKAHVPLSPAAYKKTVVEPVDEIKELSGIPVIKDIPKDKDIQAVQHAAGIS